MSPRVFLGEHRIEANDAAGALTAGRGFAYGDGVFETLRAVDGRVPWWPAHRERLLRGVARLGFAPPSTACLDTELAALAQEIGAGVIKLVLTRGSGGRGYAPVQDAAPLWTLSSHPLPPAPRVPGLVVRWCDLRLAAQPALAGLKHCNRLEQVLARAEWHDADIDEGLLRDAEGHVVCATAANVFVLRDGVWWTPPVEHCGVAGVCRGWALNALSARVASLDVDDVAAADAVFLCNAVRGILPVARLDRSVWPTPHPALLDAMRRLGDAHPAFARAVVPYEEIS